MRQLLDDISTRLSDRLRDQPAAEAAIRATIGNAYFRLGLPEQAAPHLKRALELREQLFGAESVEVARSLYDEAWNLQEYGDIPGPLDAGQPRTGDSSQARPAQQPTPSTFCGSCNSFIDGKTVRVIPSRSGREALAIARKLPDAGAEMANVLHTLAGSASAQARLRRSGPDDTRVDCSAPQVSWRQPSPDGAGASCDWEPSLLSKANTTRPSPISESQSPFSRSTSTTSAKDRCQRFHSW